jgi:hypothetical protein
MAERKNTTLSGQRRSTKSYGLREFLDDYGPMSNIIRLLKGHDDEIPFMPPGLGGLGFDALGSDSSGKSSGRMKALKEAELKAFAKILERRKREKEGMKRDMKTAAAKAKITKAEGKAKKKKQSKMYGGKVHRGRTANGNKD